MSQQPGSPKDPFALFEQQFTLSAMNPDAVLNRIAMSYQDLAESDPRQRLIIDPDYQPHIIAVGRGALWLQTAQSRPVTRGNTSISIGHIKPTTGRPVIYPELAATELEQLALELIAQQAYNQERAHAFQRYTDGKQPSFQDFDRPIVQQLMQAQETALTVSGIARRILSSVNKTNPTNQRYIDNATSMHLRFLPKLPDTFADPGTQYISDCKLALEFSGLRGGLALWRHSHYIYIAHAIDNNPLNGYAPYADLLSPNEYNIHILPLVEQIHSMQLEYPELSWGDGPAFILGRDIR